MIADDPRQTKRAAAYAEWVTSAAKSRPMPVCIFIVRRPALGGKGEDVM